MCRVRHAMGETCQVQHVQYAGTAECPMNGRAATSRSLSMAMQLHSLVGKLQLVSNLFNDVQRKRSQRKALGGLRSLRAGGRLVDREKCGGSWRRLRLASPKQVQRQACCPRLAWSVGSALDGCAGRGGMLGAAAGGRCELGERRAGEPPGGAASRLGLLERPPAAPPAHQGGAGASQPAEEGF